MLPHVNLTTPTLERDLRVKFCTLIFTPHCSHPVMEVDGKRPLPFPMKRDDKIAMVTYPHLIVLGSLKIPLLEMCSTGPIKAFFLVKMNLFGRGHFSVNESPGPSQERALMGKGRPENVTLRALEQKRGNRLGRWVV